MNITLPKIAPVVAPSLVRFNATFGYVFLSLGVLLLLIQLYLFSYARGSVSFISLFTSVFIIIAGFRYITGTYFSYGLHELQLKNLYGYTVRRYQYESLDQLSYIDGKVYLEKEGKSKRIRLSKLMSNKKDWAAFILTITKDDFGRELHNDMNG